MASPSSLVPANNSSSIVIQQDNFSFPTSIILDDTNYQLWSQLMEMRIGAMSKIGYLTGATKKPADGDPNLANWITDNQRVKSWLIDSMSPALMQRFIRLPTAREIWEAVLKTFYDGSDETRIFELNQKSFSTKQAGRPLSTYYNELCAIFQETDHRTTSPEQTVEGLVMQHSSMARLRVHIFLSGLDPEFDQVCGEILRKDPKLDLESTYAYVRKDHQQRQTMGSARIISEHSALLMNQPRQGTSDPKSRNNKKPSNLVCDHCGESGHSKQRCYEIIGYPAWWDFSKKPRKKIAGKAMVTSTESNTGTMALTDQSQTEISPVTANMTSPAVVAGNKPNVGLKIGIGFGASGWSIIIMCLIFYVYQRRQKKKHSGSTLLSREISPYSSSVYDPEKGLSNYGVHIFEYSELEQATNNFDPERELGDGGFGTVYKGKLQDGRDVAVKRLYESNFKRVEQFRNEVLILTRLRHQNLVSLYGCTSRHCRELLLVYEYIPNGTVADHLHGELARPGSLPWSTRMKIAIETASALTYLHASDVIHRDVKTNNILLDNHFCVKVADFGLSRLFPINATHISTAPQGTPGYVDPEYHQCYQLTDKSDVFSFGVVLIELISSMPAVDISRHRHEINLSNMAINKIQSRSLHELVDPNLGFESDYNTRMMITDVAELAFRCLQHEGDLRPSMEEVLEALMEIQSRDYSTGNAEERDIQEDDVKLLNVRNLTSSPDSVIGWVSSETTSSTSK